MIEDIDKKITETLSKLNPKDKEFAMNKFNKMMDIVKNGGDIQKEIKEIKEYAGNK